MVHIGVGSWSFRAVQAVVSELEKSALPDPVVDQNPARVPGGYEEFITMHYQYLEILLQNGEDPRHPPQTYTLPLAPSAWKTLLVYRDNKI